MEAKYKLGDKVIWKERAVGTVITVLINNIHFFDIVPEYKVAIDGEYNHRGEAFTVYAAEDELIEYNETSWILFSKKKQMYEE